MPIHQEITFSVSPDRLYRLLTDSEQFAAATGRAAAIGEEGARFSLFGGHIEGRQIELVPGKRIVQAWRGADWAPGICSTVRFTLKPEGDGTRLTLDHEGYPEGPSPLYSTWQEHLATNWPVFYSCYCRPFPSRQPSLHEPQLCRSPWSGDRKWPWRSAPAPPP